MDQVAAEMTAILKGDYNALAHIGVKYRSGRYPWGSGENPYQHDIDFLGRINELKKSGWTDTPENIKRDFGMSTTEYRRQYSKSVANRRLYNIETAKRLREKEGLNTSEIGRRMGVNESTVRGWFKEEADVKSAVARDTADFIRDQIETRGKIDIGSNVERELNISRTKFNAALAILEEEGYVILGGRMPQPTNPGQLTTLKVICPKDTPYKVDSKGRKVSAEVYDYENIHSLIEYVSHDGGDTYHKKFTYPESLDSKRLQIRYSEDGGLEKDGLIELRRGVDDLSLGKDMYSQVRILVDGTHYLKGMAVYSDKMPDGVDVIFNTNKKRGTPVIDTESEKGDKGVLKPIKKDDPDNPFGSAIKDADQGGQYWYTDKNGNQKLGLINKRAAQGDWTEWKDTLPAQFLSKQTVPLAKKQLNLAIQDKETEYDTITSLTNPTLKKYLLNKFADECDSAAVHLKAAALPGQKYHVIIPVNSLKDNEVYAPGYENGTKLALIRYPHAGQFEIPILTVNNKNRTAKSLIRPDSIDAVCINKKNADRLSGADFDGDTVMCIPTHGSTGVKISNRDNLPGLEDFDPKMEYPERPGMQYMTKKNTQKQMGIISNLITDMTLKGATDAELVKAVKHSMVVIDAHKHKLDYKKSEIVNDIAGLKKKYQLHVKKDGTVGTGASTLISRAKNDESVVKRQGTPKVNLKGKPWYDPTRPEGALIYRTADDAEYSYVKTNKRTGEQTLVTKTRTQKSTQMAETDDARTLISDKNTLMERTYADFANKMKAMANRARKESAMTGKIEVTREAKKEYAEQVSSLNRKLNNSLINSPREREASRRANAEVARRLEDDPEMSKEDQRKLSQRAMSRAREEVGSVPRRERSIEITDKEWEAIQSGAIAESNVIKILNNTDIDSLRERAMPRTASGLSQAKINMIKTMSSNDYTLSEIARKLGVSTSTVSNYLKGGES